MSDTVKRLREAVDEIEKLREALLCCAQELKKWEGRALDELDKSNAKVRDTWEHDR